MRLSAGSLLFFQPLRIPNRYTLFKPVQPLFRTREATRGEGLTRHFHSRAEGHPTTPRMRIERPGGLEGSIGALRRIQHAGDGPPRRPALLRNGRIADPSEPFAFSGQSYVFSRSRTVWRARASAPAPPGAQERAARTHCGGRAMSTPCVAQARLSRTRSFKLRAIINSYPPIIMRSPHPHF